MQTWLQNYTAVGDSLWLTAAIAVLPIVFFFVALALLRLKGHVAGFFTLLIALGVAIFAYKMPVGMAISSALYGFAYGLWLVADCMDHHHRGVFVQNYGENRPI